MRHRSRPPASVKAALADRQERMHQAWKIEDQLADPARVLRFEDDASYYRWRKGAKYAMRRLREEADALAAWVEGQPERRTG